MVVKTFRGLLADDTQERIKLQTSTGKVGYRIIKFQVMAATVTTVSAECVVKIFKTNQSTVDASVDFTDSDLLGVALWTSDSDTHAQSDDLNVIFDNEIFNQDIFITHENTAGGAAACNYYVELEVIPLASDEAAITTVKAMRGLAVD
jgi:hypothetical protein